MNNAVRIALLTLLNAGAVLGFTVFGSAQGWNLAKRPIDLIWQDPRDFRIMLLMLAILLVLIVLDLLILARRPLRLEELPDAAFPNTHIQTPSVQPQRQATHPS